MCKDLGMEVVLDRDEFVPETAETKYAVATAYGTLGKRRLFYEENMG